MSRIRDAAAVGHQERASAQDIAEQCAKVRLSFSARTTPVVRALLEEVGDALCGRTSILRRPQYRIWECYPDVIGLESTLRWALDNPKGRRAERTIFVKCHGHFDQSSLSFVEEFWYIERPNYMHLPCDNHKGRHGGYCAGDTVQGIEAALAEMVRDIVGNGEISDYQSIR
jgi:hypothetical protein